MKFFEIQLIESWKLGRRRSIVELGKSLASEIKMQGKGLGICPRPPKKHEHYPFGHLKGALEGIGNWALCKIQNPVNMCV